MSEISELMARDPLELSAQDIRQIIEVFRKQRTTFNVSGKPAPKTKVPAKPILGKDLLSDL
jgi:hypothetical protein